MQASLRMKDVGIRLHKYRRCGIEVIDSLSVASNSIRQTDCLCGFVLLHPDIRPDCL